MSGSGGGGGYEYQARATAYVNAHILDQQPLSWLEHSTPDTPIAVAEETNGPGDDINITLRDGTVIELQAKHGLEKDKKFWEAIVKLAHGLTKEPSLYGILLTDSTASGTIKDKLRQDLNRLGQGRTDKLKEITREVIDKFDEEGIPTDSALFRRLSIIVADFDNGSQGAKSAQILLSQVIDDKAQAGKAWNILVKDGFSLITNRGCRNAEALARLLGSESIQLSTTEPNPAIVAEHYKTWLRETTAHFIIPGFGIGLPIDNAWIQLRAYGSNKQQEHDRPKTIEEWLASYHEWSRLAVRSENFSKAFDADYIVEFNRQIVVIGGPGAGKSTLLKRLAHRLCLGKRVLLVRLPRVAHYFEQGKPFEEALLSVAADGAGIDIEQLQLILANPEYLLADGLDECDPQRAIIANALVRWAAGHPNTRVVVTTRPIGHDAGLLPGWQYTELLPLNPQGIKKDAQQLIETRFTDETQIKEQLALFEQQLETNRTASLAARNPLLLGFLVQLSINGLELVQYRAGLYKSIIELVYNQSLPDRESKAELDAPVAFRVIETTGWILQNQPEISKHKLVELLGQELAEELDIKPLVARREAEKGLKFWEERRIIERLSIGHQDVVTFVHSSLGEYAAGQYAASYLSKQKLCEWLELVRRKPKWRESMLLAAGAGAAERIGNHLLELDKPEEPTSTEAVLAATALAEVANPPHELLKKIVERLQQRLKSPISLVAFEAAEAALGLAAQAPNIVGLFAKPLCCHTQLWTRIAAMRLALACGEDHVDLDALEELIDNIDSKSEQTSTLIKAPFPAITRSNKHQYYGWNFWNQILVSGIKLLVQNRPGSATKTRIEGVVSGSNISSGAFTELINSLQAHGYKEIFAIKNEKLERISRTLASIVRENQRQEQYRSADKSFLEAVLRVASKVSDTALSNQETQTLVSLATLIRGMGWLDSRESDWLVLGKNCDLDAIDAVVAGAIFVMQIEPQRIAMEAQWILENFSKFYADRQTVLFVIPEVPVNPKRELAKGANLSPKHLVRALKYPSETIVSNAAFLLAEGAGGTDAADLVKEVLPDAGDTALWAIASIAPYIWGNEAAEVILNKLEKPLTQGSGYLLKSLPNLLGSESDQRTFKALLRGLLEEDPKIAAMAAEALSGFESGVIVDLAPQLKEALKHWTQRGSWCEQHKIPVKEYSCPECRVITPSPCPELVNILAKLRQLCFEDLIRLCSAPRKDVQESAINALVGMASYNSNILAELPSKIHSGILPDKALTKIFSLPVESLRVFKSKLIELFDAPSANVRQSMVQALAGADWLEREEAISLANNALQDEVSAVRDQAVNTLRILKHQ